MILWNVRISLRQKLALAGIFSLTIITMTFAVVRIAVISTIFRASDNTWVDGSWLYLWSSIESVIGMSLVPPADHIPNPSTAVIISCLVSFRTLFSTQDNRPPPTGRYVKISQRINNTLRSLLSGKRNNSTVAMQNMVDKSTHDRTKESKNGDRCCAASEEHILHEEMVYRQSPA